MVAFCLFRFREPRSYNSKASSKRKYMTDIQSEFRRTGCDVFPPTSDLYARTYYLHRKRNLWDADNLSKPIMDALKEYAFEDDRQVVYRTAGSINTEKYTDIDFTNLPTDLVDSFTNALLSSNPIVYIEIGDFQSSKVQFGA